MARLLALTAVWAGCGANLGSNGGGVTDGSNVSIDAPIDSPVDARPCIGGDQSMTGPDGSCFVLFTAPVTFAVAQASCAGINAHLALIKTAQDDTFAEQFVGTHDTYIGLTDQVTEGTFVWVDGSPLVFANWHLNEPNNGSGQYEEDCAIIAGARAGKQWDDRPCVVVPMVGGGDYSTLCQF